MSSPPPSTVQQSSDPPDYENLDPPIWLGRPGYESQTEHWFSLAEKGHADAKIEGTQSPLSVHDVENSNQYQATGDPIECPQAFIIEGGFSHILSEFDSLSEEAEVTASFYLPSPPESSPLLSTQEIEFQNELKRIADFEAETTTKRRKIASLILGFSSISSDSEPSYRIFQPSSLPSLSVSSTPSQTSRSLSPQIESSHHQSTSILFHGDEQHQLQSFKEVQMAAEYEEIFRGPVSNKNFLNKLKEFDKHWNLPGFHTSDIRLNTITEPPVLWRWWAAYLEAFPEKKKDFFYASEEACEAVVLEVMDEYVKCERMVDDKAKVALNKYVDAVGEEGICDEVLQVAKAFQTFVRGKYVEGTLDDSEISPPEVGEDMLAASHGLIVMLAWVYECKRRFYEGRYPAWLLKFVDGLVENGKLEVGES